jgi:hypothetical protein
MKQVRHYKSEDERDCTTHKQSTPLPALFHHQYDNSDDESTNQLFYVANRWYAQ